jgi:hypothetical protein
MKSGFFKLVVLIIGLNIFFTYIGLYFLPQSRSLPPKIYEINEGITQDELLLIGEEILFGKGQCMVCHPNAPEAGMRSPAIAGIGGVIVERVKNMNVSPDEYMVQALVDPNAYIPKGFVPIMPPSQKLLTDGELIAVAAFLQSKGSDVTISYPDSLPILEQFKGKGAEEAAAKEEELRRVHGGREPKELYDWEKKAGFHQRHFLKKASKKEKKFLGIF